MGARIRKVTLDDSAEIARVVHLAGLSHVDRGLFELMFPGTVEARRLLLERLVRAEARSFCHYSNFLAAEVDGRFAAALSGYDARESGQKFLVRALREIGWGDDDLAAMGRRLEPVLHCLMPEPEDFWIVESVATFPEFRRRGLVEALLDAIIAEGRQRGYTKMQISVLIGNTPAQNAYEKVGFKLVESKTHPEFENAMGSPGINRLIREE